MTTTDIDAAPRGISDVSAALHPRTVAGVLAGWPAQFGGAADKSKIATQWMSKGTAMSPPLFLMVGMAVALALLVAARGGTPLARIAVALAAIVGAAGVVGSFGELLSAASSDVPAAVHDSAVIGILLSAAVVVTALASLAPSRTRVRAG